MIRRYSLPEIERFFTEKARMEALLEVEVLAVEGWSKLGVIPKIDAREVREKAPEIDDALIKKVDEREKITNHDLAAFVDVIQDRIGVESGNWVHYGLTSSDVVDTAQCLQLKKAGEVIDAALVEFYEVLKTRAIEFKHTPMVGRTHGMHAEPTTFGSKLALWALQIKRDIERWSDAQKTINVGKLSGAVGTYSNIDPGVENYVCEQLGLEPVPATQVIARDRHAQLLYAAATCGATIELLSTEVRHLQRTEVGEASEGFSKGQKGSSAMPHKKNPITAERLCGLARVLRSYVTTGLENISLWHERDISHSSVERIVLPDACILLYYMVTTATKMIRNLDVNTERMLQNIESSNGLLFSQAVLLAMVESGMTRDRAYRIVQRNSVISKSENKHLRDVLAADDEMKLTSEQLDKAFSLDSALSNIGKFFESLD